MTVTTSLRKSDNPVSILQKTSGAICQNEIYARFLGFLKYVGFLIILVRL